MDSALGRNASVPIVGRVHLEPIILRRIKAQCLERMRVHIKWPLRKYPRKSDETIELHRLVASPSSSNGPSAQCLLPSAHVGK